jgi:hypothetical protein
MVLQAAIDESYTEGGVFVLAGYIASAEAWARFSKEWEILLPTSTRGPRGKYRFKMNEMINYIDKVPPFYRVIEDHVIMSVSLKINLDDFARAKSRIWSDNTYIVWGPPSDPHWFAAAMLLSKFHRVRYEDQKMVDWLPPDKKVDFYFDNRSGSGVLLDFWDEFLDSEPKEIRELYGAQPRFENDEEFPPLQAADFWAWWVREGYESGKLENYTAGDFGAWKETRHVRHALLAMSEDDIAEELINQIQRSAAPGLQINIYDEHHAPRKNEMPNITANRSTIIRTLKHMIKKRP